MTYSETLDWMFARLPMYQQRGKSAYKAKLDNILAFSEHLDYPDKKYKSIHVGGTNGKGSSSHMLASVLQEAGYTAGLYTSPHLKDFRERIRIDGKPVSKRFVINFIRTNLSFLEKHQLSFFEVTVGMAFAYFAEQKVDIAVIEVGLGGRFDSTNIITPEVALITNIGLDHVDILGDTLPKIAFQKAGIIKKNIPVVIGEFQNETYETFETVASSKNASLTYAEKEIVQNYKTSLLGNYQSKNVKGVVAVLRALKGFAVDEQHIIDGLQNIVRNTGLMGRWHILKTKPKVVCDTAHNYEGLLLVLQQIEQQRYNRLHLVLGFIKDKNLEAILPLFPTDAFYYFCRPDISRGLDVDTLQQKATALGLQGKCYASVTSAYDAALKNADTIDLIFIGGSTFTVAEVV